MGERGPEIANLAPTGRGPLCDAGEVRRLIALLGPALAALMAACATPGASPSPGGDSAAVPGYRTVTDLPLPGGSSRWAYQAFDSRTGRLYLAHQGASEVVVVDTLQQRVVTTVPGIEAVHGLALAPALGRLYAAANAGSEVAVIDLASARVVARVPTGAGPDGLAYVSSAGRLLVSDGAGGGETIVDVETNRPLARIDVGDGPSDSEVDPSTGRVLVTASGGRELVALDPVSQTVVARYPVPGCDDADGVQVDVSSQDRAFVSCGGNGRLQGVDLVTGRVGPPLEVGAGPDLLAMDLALHRLYVASESGILTVVDTAGAEPTVLTRGFAGPDAHSVSVDPNTHLVYLPLASVGGRSVLRVLAPL
jgi:DNA-binding beta-propeller fold protein YncE